MALSGMQRGASAARSTLLTHRLSASGRELCACYQVLRDPLSVRVSISHSRARTRRPRSEKLFGASSRARCRKDGLTRGCPDPDCAPPYGSSELRWPASPAKRPQSDKVSAIARSSSSELLCVPSRRVAARRVRLVVALPRVPSGSRAPDLRPRTSSQGVRSRTRASSRPPSGVRFFAEVRR